MMESRALDPVRIGGIDVIPFPSRESLIENALTRGGLLLSVNAEIVATATDRMRDIINSNTGYCDGAGAVIALHRKGASEAVRIPGCELWLDIIRRCQATHSFYFIGSRQEVVEGVVRKLSNEYPGIRIVGYHNGFLSNDAEREALIADVERTKPDIVFVAMGFPRQEYLMDDLYRRHNALYMSLGGSFDLYMGLFKRAPKLVRDMRLEWLWRFVAQPSRIGRITNYLKFAVRMYCGKL